MKQQYKHTDPDNANINFAAPNQQKNGFILRPSRETNALSYDLKFTDDHGIKCSEMRYLPYGGDGNILVSKQSYDKEIKWRKEHIKNGVEFESPAWEALKVYTED